MAEKISDIFCGSLMPAGTVQNAETTGMKRCAEAAIAHVQILKLGVLDIALIMFMLFCALKVWSEIKKAMDASEENRILAERERVYKKLNTPEMREKMARERMLRAYARKNGKEKELGYKSSRKRRY